MYRRSALRLAPIGGGVQHLGSASGPGSLQGHGRMWNLNANWCSLCKEPYNSWDQHRGKRDHVCLELFFDAIVSYGRRWMPLDVWKGMLIKQISWDGVHTSMNTIDHLRREKLLSVLFYLRRAGLLQSAFPECVSVPGRGMFLRRYRGGEPLVAHGTVLFHQLFVPPLLRLFPRAEAKQHTSFSQQIQATYNMETVWDLCNLKSLLPAPPDFQISFYEKGALMRALFGELLEFVDPVPGQEIKRGRPMEHYLAQYAVNSIMMEATYVKMMEYVTRVEPVWREYGQELIYDNDIMSPHPHVDAHRLSYCIGHAPHKAERTKGINYKFGDVVKSIGAQGEAAKPR